jgi:multidrug resistance efflux pump
MSATVARSCSDNTCGCATALDALQDTLGDHSRTLARLDRFVDEQTEHNRMLATAQAALATAQAALATAQAAAQAENRGSLRTILYALEQAGLTRA